LITFLGVPLFDWIPGADRPTPGARNKRALSYLAGGQSVEAITLYERTLVDYQRMLGPDHPNTLRARNNLAMGYLAAGQRARAIRLLERLLADCERVLGANHPDTQTVRDNLAMGHRAAGRAAESDPAV
jgi:tetratricopeptide (TPR) repeat protein